MPSLKSCFALCSLGILPLAVPAATLPIASGSLAGVCPVEFAFPNDFVAFECLTVEMNLAANASSGGFASLAGLDTSVFRFLGDIELAEYSDPATSAEVYFEYRPLDGGSSFMYFGPSWEDEFGESVYVYLFGTLRRIRLEANDYPLAGQTMDLLLEFALELHYNPDEVVAVDFHDELMRLTDGTGILQMRTAVTLNADYSFTIGAAELVAVPEPRLAALLLGVGVAGVAAFRRRHRRGSVAG